MLTSKMAVGRAGAEAQWRERARLTCETRIGVAGSKSMLGTRGEIGSSKTGDHSPSAIWFLSHGGQPMKISRKRMTRSNLHFRRSLWLPQKRMVWKELKLTWQDAGEAPMCLPYLEVESTGLGKGVDIGTEEGSQG